MGGREAHLTVTFNCVLEREIPLHSVLAGLPGGPKGTCESPRSATVPFATLIKSRQRLSKSLFSLYLFPCRYQLDARTMPSAPQAPQLPPHLREVCSILGVGLLRLRRHSAEDLTRDAAQPSDQGESSLHFHADQSVHANRNNRRLACPA